MEIIMPKMGESVNEGTIIKWHKKEGDSVKRDEIIFEISTDKVDTEIPSPSEGILSKILVPEGDTVEVGTIVAYVNAAGDGGNDNDVKSEETATKSVREEKVVEEKREEKKEESVVNTMEAERGASKGSVGGSLIEIAMPKMGESVMEGTIIKWYKQVGDKVKKDETIFEISTDKVDTEVPSPAEGILAEVLVGEQETVEVGTIVAKLSSGDGVAATQSEKQIKAEAKDEEKKEVPAAQMHDQFARTPEREKKEEVREETPLTQGKGAGFYSPLVMSIASKEGLSGDDLKSIKGTGSEGRITKKDVLSFVEERKRGGGTRNIKERKEESYSKQEVTTRKEETAKPQMEPVYSSGDVEKIPMDNIRQKIMNHMIVSRDTSVHVTAMLEVDMTKIYRYIQESRDEFQKREGFKLTYMPFISNAVVKGLKEFPMINASIEGSNILVKKFIHLGIAVSMEPNGLIVPNIKGAGERNITGLAKAINDLAFRARNRKLTPDDITNGTFTITNYGVFGTIFGTPIINQPEVAILGVGAVVKKPVVVEAEGIDTIAIKPIMALTLAHDHRLVDGMLGGKFLKYVKETLEGFDPSSI
jgi:pyruvate dehydrogenase E2 component (dihydrolipoamide acetyltransferase)